MRFGNKGGIGDGVGKRWHGAGRVTGNVEMELGRKKNYIGWVSTVSYLLVKYSFFWF